jgi:hypothetical protein
MSGKLAAISESATTLAVRVNKIAAQCAGSMLSVNRLIGREII